MVTQSSVQCDLVTYPFVPHEIYAVPSHDIGYYILPLPSATFWALVAGPLFSIPSPQANDQLHHAWRGACWRTGYFFWQALYPSLRWRPGHPCSFSRPPAPARDLTVSEIFRWRSARWRLRSSLSWAGSGDSAPWLYGKLIETSAESVFYGYLLGAGMMLVGAVVELWLGVKAEGRSLEHIATPLSAQPLSEDLPRA